MPLPSLTNFPRADWSYSSHSRLIHKDMGSYLPFNIFMSSTGVALLPQTQRADFKCTWRYYLRNDFSGKTVLRYQYSPPFDNSKDSPPSTNQTTRAKHLAMLGLLQGPFKRRDTPDTAKSMQATFDEFCTAKANQIELCPKENLPTSKSGT